MRSVHDRRELEAVFLRNPRLHAYELGDLDDAFWPFTSWYQEGDRTALIYHAPNPPTLLALDSSPELMEGLLPILPRRLLAHVPADAQAVLAKQFQIESHGLHLKMALADRANLVGAPEAVGLGEEDYAEAKNLLDLANPGNWFDPSLLGTGLYLGQRGEGRLLAVAGVHVWSPTYRVAAIGNVATHPDARGQGLGKAVVSALCRRLLETVDHIALNVKADNASAIALYRSLGFTRVGEFHQLVLS